MAEIESEDFDGNVLKEQKILKTILFNDLF